MLRDPIDRHALRNPDCDDGNLLSDGGFALPKIQRVDLNGYKVIVTEGGVARIAVLT
jgi:hypothetical protein